MKLRLEDFKEPGVADSIRRAYPAMIDLLLYLQRRYAKELRDEPDEVGRRAIVIDDIIDKLGEIAGAVEENDFKPVTRPRLNRGKSAHGK